jgi:hypothetical protein
VEHGVIHPLQRGTVALVQSPDNPGDATHRLDPFQLVAAALATKFISTQCSRSK